MADHHHLVSFLHLSLLALMICAGQAFIDGEVAISLSPLQLMYTPAHVVQHLTRDVTVRCSYDEQKESELSEISRIRIVKKSASGWELLAELRDNQDEPEADDGVFVSARISQNVKDTFIEVTWPLATPETFGIYRCDVIGFHIRTFEMASEMTSELELAQHDLATGDLMSMLKATKDDVSSLEEETRKLDRNMTSLKGELTSARDEVHSQDEKLSSLGGDVDSLDGAVDSLVREFTSLDGKVDVVSKTVDSIHGDMTLLEDQILSLHDRTGSISDTLDSLTGETTSLKEDVTFLMGKYTSISDDVASLASIQVKVDSLGDKLDSVLDELTAVSRNQTDLDGAIASINTKLGELEKSKSSSNRFDDLVSWPEGQYALLQPATGCPVDLTFFGGTDSYYQIHTESSDGRNEDDHSRVLPHFTKFRTNSNNFMKLKFCEATGVFNTAPWPHGSYCINQIDGVVCPDGFESGYVLLDVEDTNTVDDYTTRAVQEGYKPLFCCRESDSFSTPMVLPTHRPFLLYRLGGQCQQVEGMDVTEETLSIDTEDRANFDAAHDLTPDIDINSPNPTKFHLCHYTKK